MAEVVKMPKLSDTMTEGVVAEWHKKVGDFVESGELLAEIETDKATMEFESFQDGHLLHIGVDKGDTAPVDSILAILGEEGEDISELLEKESKSSEKKDEKDSKDKADKDSSDKKTKDVKSEDESEEDEDSDQSKNKKDSKTEDKSKEDNKSDNDSSSKNKKSGDGSRIFASPLAKKLAEEKGYNLSDIDGSGGNGRIVKKDVEEFSPKASSSSFAATDSYKDEKVSQMRKTIARRLSESKFTAPHFYLTIDVDMDNAVTARENLKNKLDAKFSFNDLVIKAAAQALSKHPDVNVSWQGDTIRYYDYVNIGVAVAVPEGLVVPVIKNADKKGLSAIGNEVREFAGKAKDKKIQPADMEGNTFTISNLGMFGIEHFTAIVNPPDACILAVGAIRDEAVVKNGMVVPGKRMKLTLSCDHRVVDGAKGSAFLQTLKNHLEEPISILL